MLAVPSALTEPNHRLLLVHSLACTFPARYFCRAGTTGTTLVTEVRLSGSLRFDGTTVTPFWTYLAESTSHPVPGHYSGTLLGSIPFRLGTGSWGTRLIVDTPEQVSRSFFSPDRDLSSGLPRWARGVTPWGWGLEARRT